MAPDRHKYGRRMRAWCCELRLPARSCAPPRMPQRPPATAAPCGASAGSIKSNRHTRAAGMRAVISVFHYTTDSAASIRPLDVQSTRPTGIGRSSPDRRRCRMTRPAVLPRYHGRDHVHCRGQIPHECLRSGTVRMTGPKSFESAGTLALRTGSIIRWCSRPRYNGGVSRRMPKRDPHARVGFSAMGFYEPFGVWHG